MVVTGLLFLTLAQPCAAQVDPRAGEMRVFSLPSSLSVRQLDQHGRIYGAATRTATWHVSQWNNPSGDIADFTNGVASNESLLVDITKLSTTAITIKQTGRILPCLKGGDPLEFDGLVGTNTRGNNPLLPSAEADVSLSRSLDQYSFLHQKIESKLIESKRVDNRIDCSITKEVSAVCVIFTNARTSTSFFLQIILGAVNTTPQNFWWAKGQHNGRFGYNYVLPDVADEWKVGVTRFFDMDILPIVTDAIQRSSMGMDPDLRDWRVSGAYFGDAIWGGINVTTTWSKYALTAGERGGR